MLIRRNTYKIIQFRSQQVCVLSDVKTLKRKIFTLFVSDRSQCFFNFRAKQEEEGEVIPTKSTSDMDSFTATIVTKSLIKSKRRLKKKSSHGFSSVVSTTAKPDPVVELSREVTIVHDQPIAEEPPVCTTSHHQTHALLDDH